MSLLCSRIIKVDDADNDTNDNYPPLQNVLDREEYEFVLDLACAQFEPDDPEYQRVTGKVYETLEVRRCYQALHSTRHYGPLCFYLAWNKKIDNLLTTLIQLEL